MVNKRKVALATAAAVMSISCSLAFAEKPVIDKKFNNPTEERASIITGGGPSVLVGISMQQVKEEDTQALVNELMPFANELSHKTNSITSFIPTRNDDAYVADVQNRRFQFVYCELGDCFTAMNAGYKPVLRREDMQRAVLITKSADGIKKEEQIPATAVIGLYGDSTLKTLSATFKSAEGKSTVDLNKFSRAAASSQMLDGKVDVIIVSSNDLSGLIGHHPAQFSVSAKSDQIPNAMLMARSDIPDELISKMSDAFIQADATRMSQLLLTPDMHFQAGTFKMLDSDENKAVSFVYDRSGVKTAKVKAPDSSMVQAAKKLANKP